MASKLQSILTGWVNLIFDNEDVRLMAIERAKHCAECDNAQDGWVPELINDKIEDVKGMVCDKCNCPLSAKIRSPYEKCPIDLWQATTK